MNLPGLNYDSKLGVDDLAFAAEETEKAILERLRVVFGADSLSTPRHGIVDAIDPKDLVSDETTRPLNVYPSTNDPLKVNISTGVVVTPNGAMVRNTALIEDFELVRTNANDIIVVYIQNSIIDSDPVRKTRFNVDQKVRRIQDPNIIGTALLSDFNNAVLFTPEVIDNLVVLAVITVVEITSGTSLQFDYTNTTYSYNRPWFSPVDVEHRSFIGSGTPTVNNPHGLSFNDLVSGNLTVYDQLLQTGLIQGRDDDVKGVPGTLCSETISTSRILTDTTGAVTANSRYGGVGASYIVLSRYPVQITGFYLSSHKGRAIAWDHIEGSKIIVLPGPETFTSEATIHYTEVFALEPPAQILSNTLTFTQPNTEKELVYTGGLALSELTNQFIEFDGSGPYPKNYTIFVRPDGTLLRTPEPLGTTTLLEDIGTALTPVTGTFFGPAKIKIGLADANAVSSMAISIRIYGLNVDGNAISEDVAFDGNTWVSVSVPGVETEGQFIQTDNVFTEVTEIQVLSRTDDGPNSKIRLFAEIESETAQDLNTLARVAEVFWDGLAISDLKDSRQIVKQIPPPNHRYEAAAELSGLGGTSELLTFSDDFACPKLRDTTQGTQTAIAGTFQITVNNYILIQAGDSILLPTGKTLVAIVTGSPNRAVGQYLANTSNEDTRDDMILTVNDATFDSGFVGSANAAADNIVDMTAETLGAQGNGSTSEPVEGNPTAILLSGDVSGGIDTFGETYTLRHKDYVDSTIPSTGTYEVSDIRERYLSVAMPIDNVLTVRVVLHGVPIPKDSTKVQLRARVAIGSNVEWQPWEVITGNGANFTITKASAITKIQLEIFGKASGFSLYEVS